MTDKSVALQDYGSCRYTMHHHSQLGTYFTCTFVMEASIQILEDVKSIQVWSTEYTFVAMGEERCKSTTFV